MGEGRHQPQRGPGTRVAVIVACVPGLEEIVAGELDGLGIASRSAGPGALSARVTVRQLYLVNVATASATRVLIDAGMFAARSFSELEARAASLDLGPWLETGRRVRFRITAHRSRLHHTGAIEERLRRVLDLGPASAADDPDAALVVVRVARDRVAVRVDSSGAPLHHRGWRGLAAKAPLRETLAAATLTASGWRPGLALVDPLCGSGTIAIEAARRAAGIAPGADRSFAFQHWPSFAPGTWASVQAQVRQPPEPVPDAAPIVGRDRDAGAVAAARENAEWAGVGDAVRIEHGSVSDASAPRGAGPGWIVTNPPWGGRLAGGGDLRNLYARLGQVSSGAFEGWGLAVLTADLGLARSLGRKGEVRLRARAGPRPVSLVVTDRSA